MQRAKRNHNVRIAVIGTAVFGLVVFGFTTLRSDDKAETKPKTKATTTTTTTTIAGASTTMVTIPNPNKPKVEVPDGPAPTALKIDDLKVGSGVAVKAGDEVEVHYVGVLFSNKEQFDASWDRGTPFKFTVGQGGVIKGWDQGLLGMKVGGQRRLIIPPDLAYGPGGQGSIPPNSTLVFVIDLLSIPKA